MKIVYNNKDAAQQATSTIASLLIITWLTMNSTQDRISATHFPFPKYNLLIFTLILPTFHKEN